MPEKPPDPHDLAINTFTHIWYCRYEKVGFEKMTEPEKVIFSVWQFHCEVNNGGFHQFFINPAGDFAAAALIGLIRMGAHHAATLLGRAMAVFPGDNPPKEQDARIKILCALPEIMQYEYLDQLTREFFDSPEHLYAMESAYIEQNREHYIGLDQM
jgi:hypothetical protein